MGVKVQSEFHNIWGYHIFTIVEHIQYWTNKNISKDIINVNSINSNWCFKVRTVFVDQKFQPLRHKIIDMEINLNTDSKSENVSEVDRQNLVLKDRFCFCRYIQPFKARTKLVPLNMIKKSALWIKEPSLINMYLPSHSACVNL